MYRFVYVFRSGCIDNNYVINKSKYKNNYCNMKHAIATQNSDIFMFFKGIVLDEIMKIPVVTSYLNKNDRTYYELYKLLIKKISNNTLVNKKIFNNTESEKLFVEKLAHIILDCIEPDYKIRPNADDVIIRLYKCLQIYMVQTEVDKIYQPFQKAYIDSLNNK